MPLFFTHIPRTAGTSFKKGFIFQNIAPEKIRRFEGVGSLVKDWRKPFDFLEGHYPYGIHHFCKCATPIIYVTTLREPLDRAVSYYHFIKQCDTADYQHPDLGAVKRFDIAGFYRQPENQNLQTKFTAGFLALTLTAFLPQALSGPLLLVQAKYNLSQKYHLFGLVDRMSEFQEMAAKKLGWRNLRLWDNSNVTKNRPSIDAISDAARTSILGGNQLDLQLYGFAQKLFAERMQDPGGQDEPILSKIGCPTRIRTRIIRAIRLRR
jgi:hypothetical protein